MGSWFYGGIAFDKTIKLFKIKMCVFISRIWRTKEHFAFFLVEEDLNVFTLTTKK